MPRQQLARSGETFPKSRERVREAEDSSFETRGKGWGREKEVVSIPWNDGRFRAFPPCPSPPFPREEKDWPAQHGGSAKLLPNGKNPLWKA